MGVVTLLSKFQVVIPKNVREKLDLKPGQKIVVIEKDGVIHLIPQRSIKEMRGFVKGIDTRKPRDEEDLLILIDSYGWTEYFAEGPTRRKLRDLHREGKAENAITPTIVVYEVYKKSKAQKMNRKHWRPTPKYPEQKSLN